MDISVVVPCYNEQDNIAELYKRLINTFNKNKLDLDKIILIDDGSNDDTWKKISQLQQLNKKEILGIKFSRNFGHQNAVIAGLNYCKSDFVLIIDADLQDPPEILGDMILEIKKNKANAVYAQRISRQDTKFKKITASFFYRFFNKFASTKIPSDVGDFRLIDKIIYNHLINFPEQNPFIRGLIPWTGFKQVPIEYHRKDRYKGKTGYGFFKMLNFTIDSILSFSNLPIRLAYTTSIISIILLIALIFYALLSYFKGDAVQGWTSLAVIILFFNSLNFFIIALLGEYIGRTFYETKKRPRYIVSEVLEN